jgi:uncharacterized RDD family membrane protein YckC
MQIYLARSNQQAGPYTLEQVNQMLATGQVSLTDLAWHEGMPAWKALGEMTGGQLVYQPPVAAYTPPPAPIVDTPTTGWGNPNPAKSSVSLKKSSSELATVNKRISAKIIDLTLWIPVSIIPMFFLSPEASAKIRELNSDFNQMAANQAEILALLPPASLWAIAIYIVGMLLLQGLLLAKSGQTIGKRAMKIRIVDDQTGKITNITRSFLLRSIVFIMGYNFIFLLFFVDFGFLFTERNRTLHDRLARTVVADAKPEQLAKES